MAQNYVYPSSSQVTINGIGTPNNSPIPNNSVLVAGESPTGNQTVLQTDANGNLITTPAAGSQTHVIVDSSALPAGASTSALQTSGNASLTTIASNTTGVSTAANQVTGNTSLSAIQTSTGSIDTKTPALGQALAATSVPVVLPAAQITALTPPTTVTVTQTTGTNLHAVIDNGSIAVTSSALPTGASTSANQTTEIASLAAIQASVAGPTPAGTNTIGGVTAVTPTARTVTQAAVTVGTTAVRLTVSGTAPSATRQVLVATPDSGTASTVTFYIGSATVTNSGTTRGIEIQQGQSFIANNDAGDYYIVASVAAQIVTVMEQS